MRCSFHSSCQETSTTLGSGSSLRSAQWHEQCRCCLGLLLRGNLELVLIFSFTINTQDLTFFINESKNDTANLASCCVWAACPGWRASRGGGVKHVLVTSPATLVLRQQSVPERCSAVENVGITISEKSLQTSSSGVFRNLILLCY